MLVISKSGINRRHDSSRHSEVSVESHSCLTAASGPFSPPLVTSSQQHGVCWHRAGAGAVLSREDNSRKERMDLTALTTCPSEVHGDVLLNVRSSPVLMRYLQQHRQDSPGTSPTSTQTLFYGTNVWRDPAPPCSVSFRGHGADSSRGQGTPGGFKQVAAGRGRDRQHGPGFSGGKEREGNRSGSPSRGQPAACGSRTGTARPLLRRHPARQGRKSSSLGNEQQKPEGRSLPARVNRSLLGSSRKS